MKKKLKVCGMKDPENILALSSLPVDYIGFIFYPGSSRFFSGKKFSFRLKNGIKKTGVFVNENPDKIEKIVESFQLDTIQLHGTEKPETCQLLKERTQKEIVKAFGISEKEDFEKTKEYEPVCDFFLFDTKTEKYGGSGEKYNWKIIKDYKGQTPFFLSGGIGPEDVANLKRIDHPLLYAIDINSKFEISPGLKDIHKIKQFIKDLES